LRSRNISLCLLLAAAASFALPARADTWVFSTPIAGDPVQVTLTATDAPGGNGVDLTVSLAPGDGDLLGLFGNVTNEALLPSMGVSSPDGLITQWQFKANKVSKVGGGNVMNPVGTWDWGVRIGQQGSGGGAITTASFRLTGTGLTTAHLANAATQGWVFGVRIQSTNGPEGSSKLGLGAGVPPVGGVPTIDITAPVAGALLSATPVAVSGSVTGAGVSVTVNGVAATVTGGSFSAQVPLVEGANTLTATATNAAGSASDAVAVTLDTTPPIVVITTPANGTQTTGDDVLVQGTVADASPIASFQVNGLDVPLLAGGFSLTVPLALGANPITAVAVDAAGHTGQAAVEVVRGSAPALDITAPADGTLTNQSAIAVSGSVSGNPTPSTSVNGVAAVVSAGSFSAAAVPLAEGANTLTATATNAFGDASDTVSVTRDSTPPVVTITAPAPGAELDDPVVLVTGTVADASPITALSIDGDPLAPGNSFSVTAPLVEGSNTFSVTATDAAGNTGSASVTVSYSPGNPLAITIDTPPAGALVSKDRIPVAGLVSDPDAAVQVNGVVATLTGGSYVAAAVPLVEGENVLTATATRGSDTAQATVTVSYNAPPQVVITTPADGAVLRDPSVDVEGVVDDVTAYVDVNGVVAQVGAAGRFVATGVTLVPGENPLTARAIDPLGAQGTDRVIVTRDDDAAPKLRIVMVEYRFSYVGDPGEDVSVVVYDDLESFVEGVTALGLPSQRFQPPIDAPVVGERGWIFVFAEEGDPVDLQEFAALIGFDPGSVGVPLWPITDLDFDAYNLGGYADEILPDDFEPEHYGSWFFPVVMP
jgi:hypothetical protein